MCAPETPTAADLACPMERWQANGVDVYLLNPYWQRNPSKTPLPENSGLSLANWKDGTSAPVPNDASPDELVGYYMAACVLWEAFA